MDDTLKQGVEAARAMLDLFASVGAARFDLSIIERDGKTKVSFRSGQRTADLAAALPSILASAAAKQHNVIVRPTGPAMSFVQLDDLDECKIARLGAAVFLTLRTSPGSFQAWAALDGVALDEEFARRLRKGAGADRFASGATRIAGSFNFKDKYAPDFPRVAIVAAQQGLKTTVEELQRLGLVAAPEPAPLPRQQTARLPMSSGARRWPSYQRCLDRAPPSESRPGQVRDSIADFTWCLTALDWGHRPEDVAARLMEESAKARENGERYAIRTVDRAGDALARRVATAPRPAPALDRK